MTLTTSLSIIFKGFPPVSLSINGFNPIRIPFDWKQLHNNIVMIMHRTQANNNNILCSKLTCYKTVMYMYTIHVLF